MSKVPNRDSAAIRGQRSAAEKELNSVPTKSTVTSLALGVMRSWGYDLVRRIGGTTGTTGESTPTTL